MDTKSIMRKYGWSETNQENFFSAVRDIIEGYNGVFTIKKVSGKYYWYFKFSNTKHKPRTKYLCSCDIETKPNDTSFKVATQIYLHKINHNFSNKDILEPNLSKYIDEYIQESLKLGGLTFVKKPKMKVLQTDTEITPTKNISTIKKRIRVMKEFKEFCIKNNIKTISTTTNEFRGIFKEYFDFLRNRTKLNRNGEQKGEKHLSRGTIKVSLQQIRVFLDWLSTPKDMNGRELIKQHFVDVKYQNHLLKEAFNEDVRTDRIYDDFSLSNYRNASEDCIKYIRTIWNLYCKYEGDREKIREERLSYNLKLKDGTYSGKKQKNQPKELIVMSDVVFFVSLLQLRYGFRISEILQSYRNYDSWEKHAPNKSTQMSSYFSREENQDFNEMDYYVLNIKNSKKKSRVVPIADTIYSWVEPPKGVPFKHFPKGYETSDGETFSYEHWETNIIDVIFEIFYPKEHVKTFPSPNQTEKPYQGYSNNYYLNLFKEKLTTNKEYNWSKYGINSTHNLRSYFVSYMFREEDASIELVCRIAGHSYEVALKHYQRINSSALTETLELNNIKTILKKNRLSQKKPTK